MTKHCDVRTKNGRRCKAPAGECLFHGERCGQPTKAGTPCGSSRHTCEWHAPRCEQPTPKGPCRFLRAVCPHHGNREPRHVRTCPECDGAFTSRPIKGRYCSPLCAWRAGKATQIRG